MSFALVVAGFIAPESLVGKAEAGLSGLYREESLRAIQMGAARGEVVIRGRSFAAEWFHALDPIVASGGYFE